MTTEFDQPSAGVKSTGVHRGQVLQSNISMVIFYPWPDNYVLNIQAQFIM